MPPESRPHFFFFFCEGTVISLYPLGQCKVSLLQHHVSWNITMSMSFILLIKSWSAVLFPKVEECKPCILQQLILNDFIDTVKLVYILLLSIIWQVWSRWCWAGVLSDWVQWLQGSVAVGLLRRSSVMALQGSSPVWFLEEEDGHFFVAGSCFSALLQKVVLLSCWRVCSHTYDGAECLYGRPGERLEWMHRFWKVLHCFHGSREKRHIPPWQ